ncbi:MAG: hypothetical protein ACI9SB_000941 [Candidatus Azotimanducaceae bacterium]|jgi:uncharacterized protein HemY
MAITDNLEKMLTTGRDSAMLRFGLGSAYFNQRQYAEAAPHLQACVDQDPAYTAAYKLLGKAHLKLDNKVAAENIFTLGLPIAQAQGDKQAEREMLASLKKLQRQQD